MSEALGHQAGVKKVDMILEEATFVVELDQGVDIEPEVYKDIIESWEDFGYKVGEIAIVK